MPAATADSAVQQGVRIQLTDPTLATRSPGEEFAWSVRATGPDQDHVVPFRAHLPAVFPLFATRPRYAVRHLLKTASVTDAPVTFVHEPPAAPPAAAGTSYRATPEGAFVPRLEQAELTDLTVRVPLPAGLLDQPALLASFIDYRVLVRLSVVENETLLHGSADRAVSGLLNLPEIRRGRLGEDVHASVTEAAAEVEETGGSCDGIVVHPFTYWELVRAGVLGQLGAAGITVSRTRMIPRGQVLLGDFRAAVTLLVPGVASLALRRGAGPDGSDAIEASSRIGLAVHLPQHFLLLTRD
ncbi:family 3 encapsulin nanocompartment shell protein [Streptomyces megasporus]|uniref:family 3 encapsulin nanocompartment shell protein n=1 Tax=Streptomyces megasporus TaxID=44060 RepID=UPI0004E16337|nr:family 3 encapsulin nanocompartment shell protein [Streptomyces megasporus]